jgi:N-acetylmuramoyl-L-alanine amidase
VGRRAGTSQIIWNGRDQAGYRVPDGYYTAEVRFHDWAGNNSVPLTQTVRLRVDTTPPSVTNVRVNTATPYEPDGNNDTATVHFTTGEKASYSYSIRNPFGTRLKARSVSSLALGNHATSWEAKQSVGGSEVVVPNGRYPIRLAFRDAAGNTRATTPRFPIKSYYLVCVDPGHGGKNGVYDSGAVGPTGYKESVANFDMGYYRLRPLLEAVPKSSANGYPIKVLMTRSQERVPSMTLNKRSWLANYRGANIFVSIHCNAAGGSAHGSETFYYRIATDRSRAAQSAYLATMIQRKTVARTRRYNRGVKTASFYVLRRTLMPAALHEAAFISNRTEERLLKSTAFRRSVAQGVRDGVVAYFQRYP